MSLDRARIVAEAVALLDAEGLENVTLRKLAARLGVQAPTLYWHIPNKAALITAIAEEILATPPAPITPSERWQDWLIGLAAGLRRALLAHPDGARIISMAQMSRNMASLSELAMSTLVARGIALRQARVTVLTVERVTIGFVLEEQGPPPDTEGFDLDEYTAAYPTMIAGITEYFEPGRTVDDLFLECVTLVVEGPGHSAQVGRHLV